MSEPTPGQPHRREYVKPWPGLDGGQRVVLDVDAEGLVSCTVEALDWLLDAAGFTRETDGQPQS